eukprot:scaffold90299_cov24-Attheya_sp.AAC.2
MNAEPTNPEENEEPPDDHGVTNRLQVGETESPQAATTNSTSAASATRAILFVAGENAVKNKEILITQVRLEFNLKHDEKIFNPRPKHVKILQIMKNIDPLLVIKSASDNTLWKVPNEISTFDRYKKHFAVSQTKPPRQA